jgi:hypothetical protein
MAEPSIKVTESQLQRQVETVLTGLGYLWFHDRSLQHATVRTSKPGFPDICAVHPKSGALIFIELKSDKGKMRPAQLEWKDALLNSEAVYFGPIKPCDFDFLVTSLVSLA